jgi:probable rRNA maturation factor
MTIFINNEQDEYAVDEGLFEKAALAALEYHGGVPQAQVGITLVGDEAIRELNARFRGIDRPTDVLSFPLVDYSGEYEEDGDPWEEDGALSVDKDPLTGEVLLGDLVISVATADRQARGFGHSMPRELAYLTVHGMLHLLGYDHENPQDKALMRQAEEEILGRMGLLRQAMATEGALTELCQAAEALEGPAGAAVLGGDGVIYTARADGGEDALNTALGRLPQAVAPLAGAVTGDPGAAVLPGDRPLYRLENGLWRRDDEKKTNRS